MITLDYGLLMMTISSSVFIVTGVTIQLRQCKLIWICARNTMSPFGWVNQVKIVISGIVRQLNFWKIIISAGLGGPGKKWNPVVEPILSMLPMAMTSCRTTGKRAVKNLIPVLLLTQ